jgi:tripartite-type tricarboxylate transporter receptor subunit TctC
MKKIVTSAMMSFLFAISGPSLAQSIVGGFGSTTTEYKIITNNPVGAGADVLARKISQIMQERHNINSKVYNITTGGGLASAQEFKKERLAVTITSASALAYLPIQLGNVGYTRADFNVINEIGIGGVIWFSSADSGINDLDDLVKVLPTLPKSSVSVGAADGGSNAQAFLKTKNLKVPVVTFRSNSDAVLQVAGGHVPVGVVTLTTEQIWTFAAEKKIKILGVTSKKTLEHRGHKIPSINEKFGVPILPGGAFLAMTPGDTVEHRALKVALLEALKDPEIEAIKKKYWPMGNYITLDEIIQVAQKNQDLIKK